MASVGRGFKSRPGRKGLGVTRFGWIKRYMKIVRSDQDYFLKIERYLRFKLAIAHILIYHAEISRHMSQGLE
jgi:hypothetical protein